MSANDAQAELFIPVRGGFTADNDKHKRNQKALEDWAASPFVSSAKIQNLAVQNAHIDDATITSAKISDLSADKITAGTLQAAIIMAGIIRTAETGQRWEITSSAITAYDANGAVFINIPIDGRATFKGEVEASGLLVTGNMVLRGTDNVFAEGSIITLASSTSDPSVAPSVVSFWDSIALATPEPLVGLAYDSTNTSVWACGQTKIYEFNATTGALIRSQSLAGQFLVLYGIVRVGTRVYVLGIAAGDFTVKLRTYSESNLGAYLGTRNVQTTDGATNSFGDMALSDDGSNVIVCYLNNNQKAIVNKYTRADSPGFSSSTSTSGASNPSWDHLRGFAAAESKWWIAGTKAGSQNGSVGVVERFSTGAAFEDDHDFPSSSDALKGLSHDGTFFRSLDGAALVKHSNFDWSTESPRYQLCYTWVDDNGGASAGARPLGAGDFESLPSGIARLNHVRRSKLRATTGSAPTGSTHCGFYMHRNAADQAASALDYISDIAATPGSPVVTDIVSFTAGGAAPPTTNNFPTATGAEFRTEDGSVLFRANGAPRARARHTGAAQTLTNNVEATLDIDTNDRDTEGTIVDLSANTLTVPFAGDWDVSASGDFAVNAAGRRYMILQKDEGAGFIDIGTCTEVPIANDPTWVRVTEQANLAAGAVLRLRAYQNSGGNLDFGALRWSIRFVGPDA